MNPPEKSRAERILEMAASLTEILTLDTRGRVILEHYLSTLWSEADYRATKRTCDLWSKQFLPPSARTLRTGS